MIEKTLDCIGLNCPLPALRTRQALAECQSGDVLTVLATDRFAEIDIANLTRETKDELLEIYKQDNHTVFIIKKL